MRSRRRRGSRSRHRGRRRPGGRRRRGCRRRRWCRRRLRGWRRRRLRGRRRMRNGCWNGSRGRRRRCRRARNAVGLRGRRRRRLRVPEDRRLRHGVSGGRRREAGHRGHDPESAACRSARGGADGYAKARGHDVRAPPHGPWHDGGDCDARSTAGGQALGALPGDAPRLDAATPVVQPDGQARTRRPRDADTGGERDSLATRGGRRCRNAVQPHRAIGRPRGRAVGQQHTEHPGHRDPDSDSAAAPHPDLLPSTDTALPSSA